jgi:hypothetical protein
MALPASPAESNIAPPEPIVSAQHMGGFGSDPAQINQYGASPEDVQGYQEALQGALNSLQQRVAAPNWFNVAGGFLTPGPGGFFGELGQADKALGQFVEQRRQMALPIAQMQAQLAQSKILMGQNARAAQIMSTLQAQAPQGDLSQLPLGTLTQASSALAALGPQGQSYAKAVEGALQAGRTRVGVTSDVAHAAHAGAGAETALGGIGQPGAANAIQNSLNALLSGQNVAGPGSAAPRTARPVPGAAPVQGAAPAATVASGPATFAPGAPGQPFSFNANTGWQGLAQAYNAGQMSPQQAATVLQDMQKQSGNVPPAMYQQLMRTFELDAGGSSAPGAAAAPSAGAQPSGAQSQIPLDLTSVPEGALPGVLKGATYTPASANTPRGYVPPQETQYDQDLHLIGSIAGNPAVLASKTSQVSTLLQNISQHSGAMQQFRDVTGKLASQPGLMRAIAASVDPSVGAGGLHLQADLANFIRNNVPAAEQPMANQVIQAVAQTAAMEAQMRGLPFGHGVTASQAEVGTSGLPNMDMTPGALLQAMLQTMTNAERYQTLYSGYARLSPLLRNTPDGRLNLSPTTTFFTSPYAQQVNSYYDARLQHYDGLTRPRTRAHVAKTSLRPDVQVRLPNAGEGG